MAAIARVIIQNHYMNDCWEISMTRYDVIGSQVEADCQQFMFTHDYDLPDNNNY